MSRFLLLFLFLIWMGWRSEGDAPAAVSALDLSLFFGTFALLIGMLGAGPALLARRVGSGNLRRSMRYFNRVVFAAQIFIPVWFGIGVFFLGWGPVVQRLIGPMNRWPVQLPGAIIGTVPGLLAWAGLWWSQYPADRALREQNLLIRLDQDLPIYSSPTMGEYLRQNFRLQILFSAIPILMILGVHDVFMLILWRFGANVDNGMLEGLVTLASALGVFIIVPVVLYRILGARSLPRSALRDRMEAMCRLHRLKFRDILLWPTHNRIANALVMGVAPRFRYVLLSDLLLAEMSDEQVEAVFAHELGHAAHRHMVWYLVFMQVLSLALVCVDRFVELISRQWLKLPAWMPVEPVMTLIGFGGFLLAFGFLSRRIERQADVFAARTLQRFEGSGVVIAAANPDDPSTSFIAHGLANISAKSAREKEPKRSYVGHYGAAMFASALERVASINNMPIGSQRRWEGGPMQRLGCMVSWLADLSNNWLHGSISTRMHALQHMSTDPEHTHHFDRRMSLLYVTLLVSLVVSGVLAWWVKLPI